MIIYEKEPIIITDRLLISWTRCKRKAWLEAFESRDLKRWSAHRSLLLDHQYKSLHAFCSEKSGQGIEACQKGFSSVIALRLKGKFSKCSTLEAHPTMIQRINGKSSWGQFQYRPIIVRQGKKITQAHRLSLTLWGLLLERLQKSSVKEGIVISLAGERLDVDQLSFTENLKAQLYDSIVKIERMLINKEMRSLTSNRKKCAICSWKKFCDKDAKSIGHLLSLIHI